MRRASRRGRLARVLAASALARLAAAYETVVRDGALVPGPPADGSTWTAAVATPALEVDANADAVPGALALAPGGALRVTRATRANTPDPDPDPDPDVAAVLVLGARAPREGQEPVHLALDVRASPLDPDNTSPPAWTSCDLTLDHLGAWRASTASPPRAEDDARDEPVDPPRVEPSAATAACTVAPLAPRDEDESIPNLPPVDGGGGGTDPGGDSYSTTSASVLVRARVEVSLQVSPVPTAANPIPKKPNANDAFAVDSRVDVVALASPSTRDAVVVAVDGLAIVRASDLVELAWAWVSRAARCAAELYGAVVSSCGGGDASDASDAFDRIGAAALVGGCCAAVASYANAGCDCATRVVPTETLLVGETLAAARDSSAIRAAARSLAELCGADGEDEGVDRDGDDDSGCVAASATLAAVRAFVARDAAANAPNVDVSETSANAGDTARDSVVVASASRSESQSQSDDAYGAFLEWLGREDEPTDSATPPPSEPGIRNVAAPPPRPRTAPTVSSPPRSPTNASPATDASARGAPPAVAAFAAENIAEIAENTDTPKNAPDARHRHGAWSNGWEAGVAAGAGVASLACVACAALGAFAARRGRRRRWWSLTTSSNDEARRETLVRSDVEGAVLVARRVVPGKATRAMDRR